MLLRDAVHWRAWPFQTLWLPLASLHLQSANYWRAWAFQTLLLALPTMLLRDAVHWRAWPFQTLWLPLASLHLQSANYWRAWAFQTPLLALQTMLLRDAVHCRGWRFPNLCNTSGSQLLVVLILWGTWPFSTLLWQWQSSHWTGVPIVPSMSFNLRCWIWPVRKISRPSATAFSEVFIRSPESQRWQRPKSLREGEGGEGQKDAKRNTEGILNYQGFEWFSINYIGIDWVFAWVPFGRAVHFPTSSCLQVLWVPAISVAVQGFVMGHASGGRHQHPAVSLNEIIINILLGPIGFENWDVAASLFGIRFGRWKTWTPSNDWIRSFGLDQQTCSRKKHWNRASWKTFHDFFFETWNLKVWKNWLFGVSNTKFRCFTF